MTLTSSTTIGTITTAMIALFDRKNYDNNTNLKIFSC